MWRGRGREGHGENKRGDNQEGRVRSLKIHQTAIPREKQNKLRGRNCETNNLRKCKPMFPGLKVSCQGPNVTNEARFTPYLIRNEKETFRGRR